MIKKCEREGLDKTVPAIQHHIELTLGHHQDLGINERWHF